tara:strand:+ start:1663 stop:2010 length:348 start_codon:yes stop_codon:yes gene_type:complete
MSVFNIEPHHLIVKETNNRNIRNDYEYDFLNNEKFQSFPYYGIINTYDNYKLINIYHSIFLRLFKIHKIYPEIKLMNKIENKITPEEFNKSLKEYINGNLISMIIIANAIQIYNT